jgi:hypothetical protein
MRDEWIDQLREASRSSSPFDAARAVAASWRAKGQAISDHEVAGIEVHLRSARGRRRRFIERRHPLLLRLLDPAVVAELLDAWLSAPPGPHPDWALHADGFVDLVARRAAAGEVPLVALELARHEAALALTRRANAPIAPAVDPSAIAVNPTLSALSFAFGWPAALAVGRPEAWPDALPGVVHVGYFLDPAVLDARWAVLDASALAGLRIAAERLSLEQVAAEIGASVDDARALVLAHAASGLLVASPDGWNA